MNRWLHFSRSLAVAASLTLIATAAHAAGGFNLSWGDCGTAGTQAKTFACTSNTLTGAIMIASAVAPTDLAQLNGEESVMTVQVNQPTLSNWWHIESGGCRGTSTASVSFDFTGGPFTCLDPWTGQGAGGMNAQAQFDGANRTRIRTIGAIPGSTAITGTDEYYFFKITILGGKSTGNGSCTGCQDGACIVLNLVRLTQPLGVGDFDITTPLNRDFVEWQAGAQSVAGGCPAATPTKNRTWGSVKSLYR